MTEGRNKMERTDIKITRYVDGDFWVDVVEATDFDGVEVWLTHKKYGISTMMFGEPYEQMGYRIPYDFILEIIESNLPEYEQSYIDDYVDETDK